MTPTPLTTYQLIPVDYIAGQQLVPYWNSYLGGTQVIAGGRSVPGGGAQGSGYNTPSNNFAGGVNFPGSQFGGPYLYSGKYYVVTADTLFASVPGSNGPSIWQSPDCTTWTRLATPPSSSSMDWRNGWSMFWNPSVAPNLITFRGASFANAVDFNLATLTWSAIYGTNSVPLNIYLGVVRLSDGRLRTISTDTSTPNIYYTTCSAGGTWGTVTNIPIVPAWTRPYNWDQGGLCVDGSDRVHSWWRFSQSSNQAGGTPPAPVTAYFNIDTTGALTTQTSALFDHSKATAAMLATDNVYVGAVGLSATNSVDVYVGVGLSNPVWHVEQVAIGTYSPDHLFFQIMGGLVTLAWEEQSSSAGISSLKIKMSQRSSGVWSAPVTLLDLAVTPTVSSQTANSGSGFSFYPDSSSPFPSGIRLVVALNISPDANGTYGTMVFTPAPVGGSGPPPPTVACPTATSTQVGTPYSSALTASGGTPPYTFTLMSGPLPPGLSLNTSTGVISGTPTAAGTFPYTVKVTDSLGVTASVTCSIAVSKPAAGGGSPKPSDVEFILRRVYVSMIPNKRVPVRGR